MVEEKGNANIRTFILYTAGVAFWLLIWQLLPLTTTPWTVLISLVSILNLSTLMIAASTCGYVLIGFSIAFFGGAALAYLSFRFEAVRALTAPIMFFCKSTPVAVIIMALLLYFTPTYVGVVIAVITVAPIVFSNVLSAFENLNKNLSYMARAFGANQWFIFHKIELPQIIPALSTSGNLGLGFAFKASVAAQVIAVTTNSIGEQIYFAKLYINSNLLFAWLVVILITGCLLNYIVLKLLEFSYKKYLHIHQ